MLDLIVRGGSVVDGTGAPARTMDVAIDGSRIVDVGRVEGKARREIDADGLLVTPGFIDVHTHYDAQILWDELLGSSCWHGVTTIVMGNCGVGLAPVRPDDEELVIQIMQHVEDIPADTIRDAVPFGGWESIGELMGFLSTLHRAVDFAVQIPYACVRTYVMRDRRHSPSASDDDIAQMRAIIRDGLDAGAVGLTMVRQVLEPGADPRLGFQPGAYASDEEFLAVTSVLGDAGHGVLELSGRGAVDPDVDIAVRELALLSQAAQATRRPVTYLLFQVHGNPDAWRTGLALAADARARGIPVYPQVHGRSPGILIGLTSGTNLLVHCPSYASVAHLPAGDRARRIRSDPRLRERLVAELDATKGLWLARGRLGSMSFDDMFPLGTERPVYEPEPSDSVAAIARRAGRGECEVLVDEFLKADGTALVQVPFLNFAHGDHEALHEMIESPITVLGLADGGAHLNSIIDAGVPTHMLEHWARDRRSRRIPLESVVRMLTSDAARLYGFHDRGVIAPGMRADLNLIDFATVRQKVPRLVRDLPAGGTRFVQESAGYIATVVAGVVTFEDGVHTGALPGRLVRHDSPG